MTGQNSDDSPIGRRDLVESAGIQTRKILEQAYLSRRPDPPSA